MGALVITWIFAPSAERVLAVEPPWSWVVAASFAVLLGLSVLAVVRARRRLLSGLLLGLNVVLTALFFGMLYVFSAVPPAAGPPIGAPAPDFVVLAAIAALPRAN